MLYDSKLAFDAERCLERVKYLISKGRLIEVLDKNQRTIRQNNYMHLLIGALAMETGNKFDYVKKEYFKKQCNPDLFIVRKYDRLLEKETEDVRHSSELTVEEMSMAIDRFKRFAAENGYLLPEPEDRDILRMIEVEMGRQKQYLY